MSEWISVKDRLPKQGENVVIYCKREYESAYDILIGWVSIWGWHSLLAREDEGLKVYYWIPKEVLINALPSPPGEEE